MDAWTEIAVQINGKNRGVFSANFHATQEEVEREINVRDYLGASDPCNEVRKVIFVPGKLINFVVR